MRLAIKIVVDCILEEYPDHEINLKWKVPDPIKIEDLDAVIVNGKCIELDVVRNLLSPRAENGDSPITDGSPLTNDACKGFVLYFPSIIEHCVNTYEKNK